MANIDVEKIRLIVEKNMRDQGLGGGQLEQGWKKTISMPDGNSISQNLNLQTLRDIISLSIFDILTNTDPEGTYSVDNTPGSQTLNHISDNVSLLGPNVTISNNITGTNVLPAARKTDAISITDPKFTDIWTVFVNELKPVVPLIGPILYKPYLPNTQNAILAAYPLPIPVPHITPSGIIASGSSIVNIG